MSKNQLATQSCTVPQLRSWDLHRNRPLDFADMVFHWCIQSDVCLFPVTNDSGHRSQVLKSRWDNQRSVVRRLGIVDERVDVISFHRVQL